MAYSGLFYVLHVYNEYIKLEREFRKRLRRHMKRYKFYSQ
jgi:hypothetical protein